MQKLKIYTLSGGINAGKPLSKINDLDNSDDGKAENYTFIYGGKHCVMEKCIVI